MTLYRNPSPKTMNHKPRFGGVFNTKGDGASSFFTPAAAGLSCKLGAYGVPGGPVSFHGCRTTYWRGNAVFLVRHRNGHDHRRAAVFCLSRKNEAVASDDHGCSGSFASADRFRADAGRVAAGLPGETGLTAAASAAAFLYQPGSRGGFNSYAWGKE